MILQDLRGRWRRAGHPASRGGAANPTGFRSRSSQIAGPSRIPSPEAFFFRSLEISISIFTKLDNRQFREDLLSGYLSSRNLKIAVFTINVAAWPWLGRACVPPRSGARGRPPSPPPGGVTPQPCASPGARWRCGSRDRSSRRGCNRTTRWSRCRKVPSRDCPAATP